MVLNRLALVVALLAACNSSLFDNNPGGNGSNDGGPPGDGGTTDTPPVPLTCPDPCIGDAAGDYDGSTTGANGRWRYLDDTRNRAWTPMTGSDVKTGTGMNKIASCDDNAALAACTRLPGALLFSSSGATMGADPAIELTVPDTRVLQLSLRVHVPSDGRAQVVRIYRQAREDALYTGTAEPGTTLEHALTVDAFAGDRFLFALAPSAFGTNDVAVELFASETGEAFPKHCQLGLSYEPTTVTGTTVLNVCSSTPNTLSSFDDSVDPEVAIAQALVPGPFPELGMAGDYVEGRRLDSTVMVDRSGDTTMQVWLKFDQLVFSSAAGIVISDFDLDDADAGGGIIDIFNNAGTLVLESGTVTDGVSPVTYNLSNVTYPNPNDWHFIRVSHAGDTMNVCVDGAKVMEIAVPAGSIVSNYPLRIGRNSVWNPQFSYLDASLDDVRVFKGIALPCE